MTFRYYRKSDISGRLQSMELPITASDIEAFHASGKLVQDYFPQLSDEQHEFITTGITPTEWDNVFGDDSDSEEQSFDAGEAKKDLDRYNKLMMESDGLNTLLDIERKYGLEGYPPNIVCIGLYAAANGNSVNDAIADA